MAKGKEWKKDLEQAEKLIKLKNFSTAQIYINKVLSINPTECRALVFKGTIEMNEGNFQDAEDTLTTAMEKNPGKALPAMALMTLSEKHSVSPEKVKASLVILRKHTRDSGDVEKFNLYTEKLLDILVQAKSDKESIRTLLVAVTRCSDRVEMKVLAYLYSLNNTELSEQELVKFVSHLEKYFMSYSSNIDDSDEDKTLYKVFLKLSYEMERFDSIFDTSKAILNSNLHSWMIHMEVLNIILLQYVLRYAESFQRPSLPDEYSEILLILSNLPDNGSCIKATNKTLASAILFTLTHENARQLGVETFKKSCKDNLQKLISLAMSSESVDPVIGIFVMSLMSSMNHALDSTAVNMVSVRTAVEHSLKFTSSKRSALLHLLHFFHLKDLLRNFQNAATVIDKIDELLPCLECGKAKEYLLYMKAYSAHILENVELLSETSSLISESSEFRLHLSTLLKQSDTDDPVEVAASSKSVPLKLVRSRFLLRLAEKLEEAREILDDCEILEPFNADVHYHFALYHHNCEVYSECAASCVKAYSMNPYHLAAVKLHGELYFRCGKFEKLRTLYRCRLSVFTLDVQYQMWLSLAVRLFKCCDYHFSVECISQCRMADRNKFTSWMLIALIYFQSDSFESALNCALKSLQLIQKDPEFLPSAVGSDQNFLLACFITAASKLSLAFFEKAARDFETCLALSRNYLPALCHVTICVGKRSYQLLEMSRISESAVFLQKAITCAFELVKTYYNDRVPWKILGDTLLCLRRYEKWQAFEVPGVIMGKSSKTVLMYRHQLLQLATRAFIQALKRGSRSNPALWRDLSVACFQVGTKKYLDLSVHFGKIALSLDQYDHQMWILVGSICSHERIRDFKFAQHCFLSAYNLNEDDLNPLCYLGFLYWKTGRDKSAEKIFEFIEREEPSLSLNVFWNLLRRKSSSPSVVVKVLQANGVKALSSQTILLADRILRNGDTDRITFFEVLNQLASLCIQEAGNFSAHYYHGLLLEKEKLLKSASSSYMNALECETVANRPVVISALLRCNRESAELANRLFQYSTKTIDDQANLLVTSHDDQFHSHEQSLNDLWKCIREKASSPKGINCTMKFQKLYVETLNRKYLSLAYLSVSKDCSIFDLPDFGADLESCVSPECHLWFYLSSISSALKANNKKKALIHSQKLVFLYPWLCNYWSPLIYSLRVNSVVSMQENDVKTLTERNYSRLGEKLESRVLNDPKSNTAANFVFPDLSGSYNY